MNTLERVESALTGLTSARAASRDGTPVLEITAADVHEVCRRLRDTAGFETNTFVTAIDRFPVEPRFEVYWQFLSLAHNDRVRLVARIGERAPVSTSLGSRSAPASPASPASGASTASWTSSAAPSASVSATASKSGATSGDHLAMGKHLGDSVLLETRPSGASVTSSTPAMAATPAPGGTVDASPRPVPTSVPSIVDLYPGAAYSERECYDMFGIVFDGHANLKRLLMPEEYGHFPLRKDFPHQGIEPDRLYREWDAKRHRARVEPAPARESVP